MSRDYWGGVLRQNWYLVLAAVICLTVAVVRVMMPAAPPPVEQEEMPADIRAALQGQPAEVVRVNLPAAMKRQSVEDRARASIASHQDRLDAAPDAAEAPALMLAMGNLNRQKLLDYAEAARHYENLLATYPDWEGIDRVYPQLMACYEQLNDRENFERVCRAMMQKFPAGSGEYDVAKDRLAVVWETD